MHLTAIFSGMSAAFSFVAAIFWIRSATTETLASGRGGSGSGFDGYLVGLNAHGNPVDLVPTLQAQSLWNSRAAIWAAIAALMQVAEVVSSHIY
jgi:hypothetical protein